MNKTHDPSTRSWVDSANSGSTDFPLQNLPFGVFRMRNEKGAGRVCVAIGDFVLPVESVRENIRLDEAAAKAADACSSASLNQLMALGPHACSSLRSRLFEALNRDLPEASNNRRALEQMLIPMNEVEMLLPVKIGDYTDFYASIYHASNVGSMLRPENPLFPNYKYLPVGYHGRSSSIVVGGSSIRRPSGQTRDDSAATPTFGPSRQLDYELELGIFVGKGNSLGEQIRIENAEEHLFGLCLLNDWSARDIQKWEYQPLGPFLAKNFATTISPWIVTLEALEPFRTPGFQRPENDPQLLPHLDSPANRKTGGIDIILEVLISSEQMRKNQMNPIVLSKGSFTDMYWTIAQMLTHHASNGCNLRPGDLLGSGTVSGPAKESRGCLLELTWRGAEPIRLPTGEVRKFLEDGDEVIIRGYCQRENFARIGFGECRGIIR